MIGQQPKRTLVPGGMTASGTGKRRHLDLTASSSVVREAANRFLNERGVPSQQYGSRNTEALRQP